MHSAPAVAYPVARSLLAGRALAVLAALAACPALWWAWQGAPAVSLLWTVLAWGAAVAIAWWQWRSLPQGRLRWDGQSWWWADARGEQPVQPQVRLDLQRLLLVQTAGVHGWLWLEAGQQPALWGDLRRALYGPPAREQAPAKLA